MWKVRTGTDRNVATSNSKHSTVNFTGMVGEYSLLSNCTLGMVSSFDNSTFVTYCYLQGAALQKDETKHMLNNDKQTINMPKKHVCITLQSYFQLPLQTKLGIQNQNSSTPLQEAGRGRTFNYLLFPITTVNQNTFKTALSEGAL